MVGLAVLVVVAAVLRLRDANARCGPARARLDDAWTPLRERTFLERANVAPLAAAFSTQVRDLVAGARSEWNRTCDGADEPLRTCVLLRVDALVATAHVLGEPPSNVRATSALLSRLEGPERCSTPDSLTPPPRDEAKADLARRARAQALRADAYRYAGEFETAEGNARGSIDLATQSGWAPMEADARVALAQVLRARGQREQAQAVLGEALPFAERGGHLEAVVRIALQQWLLLAQAQRFEESEAWVARAEAALTQHSRPRLRAEADVALTALRVAQGRFEEASAASERALAWLGPRDAVIAADVHALRAQNFLQFGLEGRGLDAAKAASEGRVQALGAMHPLALQSRLVLGEANARCGHVKLGLEQLTSALDDARTVKEVNALTLASALSGLSLALELGGQPAEALNAMKQADELVKANFGERHRASALASRALAERLFAVGRDDDAFALMQSALEVSAATAGEHHRETLETRARLALLYAKRGRPQAADEARAVVEAVQGHPDVGEAPLVAARLALALLPGAGATERAAALAIAQKVRGPNHPDVVRVLLLEKEKGPALDEQLQVMDVDPNSLH